MSFISGFTELFKGKKQQEAQKPQPVSAMSDQQHQEALRAWNSVDPHPGDVKLMNNVPPTATTANDEREIANKRAELNQIAQAPKQEAAKPILTPVQQTPNIGSFERPMTQAPIPEEKAA